MEIYGMVFLLTLFSEEKNFRFFEVNFRLRLYLWDALRMEICLLLALTRYEC